MQTYQLQPPSLDSHLDSQSKIMLRRITEGWINRAKVRREPVALEFDPKRSDFLEALLPFHHHPAFQALPREDHQRILSSGWLLDNEKPGAIATATDTTSFSYS